MQITTKGLVIVVTQDLYYSPTGDEHASFLEAWESGDCVAFEALLTDDDEPHPRDSCGGIVIEFQAKAADYLPEIVEILRDQGFPVGEVPIVLAIG